MRAATRRYQEEQKINEAWTKASKESMSRIMKKYGKDIVK